MNQFKKPVFFLSTFLSTFVSTFFSTFLSTLISTFMHTFFRTFLRIFRGVFLCGFFFAGALQANPVIVRTADQAAVTRSELIGVLRQADVVILGELHDNPDHHKIRGELIQALARPGLRIVAEHLTLGQTVDFRSGLLPALEAAGFSAKAWAWPIHEPLFRAVEQSGLPLLGANLSPEQTSQVFKTRGATLPSALQALLAAAPFNKLQQESLESELMLSHCGVMPASMLPGMTWAQRGRDAAMASAAIASTPSILLAGNGHAWRDVGVPQIIANNKPQLKVISVIFQEQPVTDPLKVNQATQTNRADYVWVTPPISRPDPCLALKAKK